MASTHIPLMAAGGDVASGVETCTHQIHVLSPHTCASYLSNKIRFISLKVQKNVSSCMPSAAPLVVLTGGHFSR